MDDHHPKVYPHLENNEFDGPPNKTDYRLTEISRLQDKLIAEGRTRSGVLKKYNRAINVLDGLDMASSATALVLGGVGTGLLATVVATPIVPVIMGVAATCGLLSTGVKIATRKLRVKAQKHDQIRMLAEHKHNSVVELVSKALEDGAISQSEFRAVVSEIKRYNTLKDEIRKGTKKKTQEVDENTKKEWIELGKKEAHQSFIKKLGVGGLP